MLTAQEWNWRTDGPAPRRSETACEPDPTVWFARAPAPPELAAQLSAWQSPDERARQNRFQQHEDRQRFLIARGLLRVLAARHLGIPPAAVAFAYGPFGKPHLAEKNSRTPWHFNVSHSGDLVVLAVSHTHEIGVDVERVRAGDDWDDVARTIFDSTQHAQWSRLPQPERTDTFLRAWTRREAALKALGLGLAAEDIPAWLARVTTRELKLPSGYVGALATHAGQIFPQPP